MVFVFCFELSTAQEITMKQTIDYINGKLSPRCIIDVVKGNLIAVYKDGVQTVREDEVNLGDLDISSIKYDLKENIFSINCKGAPAKKCVTRDLHLLERSNYYPRTSFEAYLDTKSAEGMKRAFTHMIRMVVESKYKSNEPFE